MGIAASNSVLPPMPQSGPRHLSQDIHDEFQSHDYLELDLPLRFPMAFDQTECCRFRRFPSAIRLAGTQRIVIVGIHLNRSDEVRS